MDKHLENISKFSNIKFAVIIVCVMRTKYLLVDVISIHLKNFAVQILLAHLSIQPTTWCKPNASSESPSYAVYLFYSIVVFHLQYIYPTQFETVHLDCPWIHLFIFFPYFGQKLHNLNLFVLIFLFVYTIIIQ